MGFAKNGYQDCVVDVAILHINNIADLFLLSYLSLLTPAENIKSNLKNAFERGELVTEDWPIKESWPKNNVRYGDHDWDLGKRIGVTLYNECFIYSMSLLRGDSRLKTSISPFYVYTKHAELSRCEILYKLLDEEKFDKKPKWAEVERYHQYFLGHRVVASFLLPIMEVSELRFTLKFLCYGLLFVALFYCAVQLVASINRMGFRSFLLTPVSFPAISIIIISLVFLFYYGLPYFAISISHAPSDIAIFAFMLYGMRTNLFEVPADKFYRAIVVFGCATSLFEILVGAIPMGLCLLFGMMAAYVGNGIPISKVIIRGIVGSGAYVITILVCFLLKLVVTHFLFGHGIWLTFFRN